MKFISKFINYFILLTIFILSFSLSVYAEDNIFSVNGNYYSTLEDAISATVDGDTIIFEKDYYTDNFIILKIQKKINIDLKGHTYSSTSCYGNFYVYSGDVTFTDSVGGGKVVNTAFENANAKTFMVYKKYTTYISKLTLNNINIISNSYDIYLERDSEAILNNVIVTGKYNFYIGNNVNLTINGGTYTASSSQMYGLNVTSVDNTLVTINSGNFTSSDDVFMFSTALDSKLKNNFINGGSFNKDVTNYILSSKKVINSGGLYTVVDKNYNEEDEKVVTPLDDDVDDDENYCKIYRDQLSQKDSEINDLKSQIEQLKAELTSKESALNTKEMELNTKEAELNNREEELNNREAELNNREDEINEKEISVLNQKNFNDIQGAELIRKEEELDIKEEELTLKENDLTNREEELLDKDSELASKESMLNDKYEQLDLRELSLNDREEEYNRLYSNYLDKLKLLEEKENKLTLDDGNKFNVSINISPLDESNNTNVPVVGIVDNDIDDAIEVINSSLDDNVNVDRDLKVVFNYSINSISNSVMNDIINQYGDKYYLNDVFDIGFNVLDNTNNSYVGNITKLNKKIRFTILLPESLKNCDDDDIYIVKLHDGKYSLIKANISSDRKYLTFETSEFSVFGILSVNNTSSNLEDSVVLAINDSNTDSSSINTSDIGSTTQNLSLPKTSSSSIINNLSIKKYFNNNNNLLYFIYSLLIGTIAFIFGIIVKKVSLKL